MDAPLVASPTARPRQQSVTVGRRVKRRDGMCPAPRTPSGDYTVAQRARRLEADRSQAATTPLANHEDDLSPAKSLRESLAADGCQRVGDSGPVANPIVSFPGPVDETQ
jgi:hypothetical protein